MLSIKLEYKNLNVKGDQRCKIPIKMTGVDYNKV
jgi:hypothetical protein